MTDAECEMVKNAALAAGYKWRGFSCYQPLLEEDPCAPEPRIACPHNWNPLKNDGDAFRLMVKLDIDVQHRVLPTTKSLPGHTRGVGAAFVVNDSYVRIVEWYLDDDRAAATRRAITRAAAAVQEAKEARDA